MKKIYLIPTVLLFFACNSMKKTTDSDTEKVNLYTTLYSSTYNGRDSASNLIVKNQADLDALFQSVNSEERPKVDFSANQVVVLFLGQKNNGGYSIAIERVEEEQDKIVVYKKIETPKPGEMVTMALSNPFVIAEIRSQKEIIFR